jgi:hypothetical protein
VNAIFKQLLFCPFALLTSVCGELLQSLDVGFYFFTLKSTKLKHFYLMDSSEMTVEASHVIKKGDKTGEGKKLIFLSCRHGTPKNKETC